MQVSSKPDRQDETVLLTRADAAPKPAYFPRRSSRVAEKRAGPLAHAEGVPQATTSLPPTTTPEAKYPAMFPAPHCGGLYF